jgi:transcriptional regulator with XRE-family HTH domain/Zn-dependent peptidase ImmA (M78 family)
MSDDDAHQIGLGRRVATLREAAGLTQAELARRLHVTQSAVSRIESGSRRLSAAQLVRLAEILGIEPGVLLATDDALMPAAAAPMQDDPASTPMQTGPTLADGVRRSVAEPPESLRRLAPARKHGRRELRLALGGEPLAPQYPEELEHLHRLPGPSPFPSSSRLQPSREPRFLPSLEPPLFAEVVRDWLEVAGAVANAGAVADTGAAPALLPDRPGVVGLDPHISAGGADPVRLARFWRQELGVGERGPLPDLVVLLEAAGVQVIVARLEGDKPHGACAALPAGAAGPAGTAGAADAGAHRIPFVFVNSFGRPVALQRFALAHEFAHLALGHGEAYDELIDWSGRNRREVEANMFAEEFTAPLAAVRHWFEMEGGSGQIDDIESVARLANHFGVSFWVARYRAKAAGLLTSPTRLRDIDRELRRRELQTLPRQLFLGGLRDTLSVLSSEMRPGQEQNQLRIAPQGVRVPGPMRAAVLRLLEAGVATLEEAQTWLRIGADDLRYQLAQFGVE